MERNLGHNFQNPRIHLLVSVLLTDSPLPNQLRYEKINDESENKLTQFLTSVHTLSTLEFDTSQFHIKLSDGYRSRQQLIESRILDLFPKTTIFWARLELFDDWQRVSLSIPRGTNLIFLQSNHDHAFVSDYPQDFLEFSRVVANSGPRAIGSISHWPEKVADPNLVARIDETTGLQYFIRGNTWTIGTCLVTPELFREWWDADFTQGSKIVRPDNPFGPSVDFESAADFIPNRELFRHLDGYSHVGVRRKSAAAVKSCCKVESSQVIHFDWKRGYSNSAIQYMDLPIMPSSFEIENLQGNRELLLLSSAYRLEPRNIVALINPSGKLRNFELLKMYWVLITDTEFNRRVFKLFIRSLFLKNDLAWKFRKVVPIRFRKYVSSLIN